MTIEQLYLTKPTRFVSLSDVAIMVNLQLPDMDGSLLISRVLSAKHNTPVVALSVIPQARLRALTAGADDAVERDIDRAELIARIRAIVRRSRGYS